MFYRTVTRFTWCALRILAYLETATLIVLVCIAVPLKRYTGHRGNALPVCYGGTITPASTAAIVLLVMIKRL